MKDKSRLDLAYENNDNCKKGCNKIERVEITENDLCTEAMSVVDGLPVRCVGEWAQQKIYHLIQYFGIFANGMKNKWSGKLNYIEICSGPGRCIAREEGLEFDGTALSILKHDAFQHLYKALYFDFNHEVINTLNKRIENLGTTNAKAYYGDYNNPDEICKIIQNNVDPFSLNLVFIDPTDCSVPFRLIEKINDTLQRVDFIINLASRTDYNRNVINAFLKPESYSSTIKKYSEFINNDDFFTDNSNIKLAREKRNNELRSSFRESYIKSMRRIGYKYFEYKNINHFYDILFATSNEQGISFWKKANKIDFNGQRELF